MIYDTYSLDDLPQIVDASVKTLAASLDRFDVIVVTGLSGVTVGVPVSLRLHMPLVVIRKPGESAHSRSHLNRDKLRSPIRRRWLFLDDFISSGATLDRVKMDVAGISASAIHVGNFLYNRQLDHIGWVDCPAESAAFPSPVEMPWPLGTYSISTSFTGKAA